MDGSFPPPRLDTRPVREPMFNVPWPVMTVVLAILGAYLVQIGPGGGDDAIVRYGLHPAELWRGHPSELMAMLFLHGGWPHAIMNALGVLAFGAPVARYLGLGPRGGLAFFTFYLACGLISGLAYAAVHPTGMDPVVGASGAVSGLMGAASRLFGARRKLNALNSSPVVSLAIGWVAVNAIMAVFGAGALADGARIAWEAHIAGFVAGALLIGAWGHIGGPAPLNEVH